MLTTVIKPNTYQDSVSLMLLSQELTGLDGVNKVSVMMGTPANKDILRATGFASAELDAAAPGDMVLGMDLVDGTEVDAIVAEAEEALRHQTRAELRPVCERPAAWIARWRWRRRPISRWCRSRASTWPRRFTNSSNAT